MSRLFPALFLTVCLWFPASLLFAEDEHSAHHPNPAALPDPSTTQEPSSTTEINAEATASSSQGGMMEGMGKMMEGMMRPQRSEIYPSLMALPETPPEKRIEIRRLAEERIHEGVVIMEGAEAGLQHALDNGLHDEAIKEIRSLKDGLAKIESGVAAHRLVIEGKPAQQDALKWFRQTMSLPTDTPNNLYGLSWFHIFVMAALLVFLLVVIFLYFYKVSRIRVLLERLSPGRTEVKIPSVPSVPSEQSNQDLSPSKPNSWKGYLLVGRIFQETPQVKTFRLVDPNGGKLPFSYLPGQFLTFSVTPHGQQLKRSYTISSSPTMRDYCEVTVRHEPMGIVSSYLSELVHEGELLHVTAPSGKFTFIGDDAKSIVLIAGGVGVTPMMSIIRYLTDRSWPGDIYLIYGCKTDTDVIFREEMEHLIRRFPNLHVTIVAGSTKDPNWPYATGRISEEILARSVPDIQTRHIHLCGPKPMMDAVKDMLEHLQVPTEQIETEAFVGKEIIRQPETMTQMAPGGAPTSVVTFAKSGKVAPITLSKTILEAAEDVGVEIDYSCRSGTCGLCKVKLLSGSVTMEVEDALDPDEKANRIILACQARTSDDVSIDA
jgi:ferredoxin-NADP reductase